MLVGEGVGMSEKIYWRDVYDAAEKRISELEASSVSHTDNLKNRKTMEIEFQSQIDELREHISNTDKLIREYEQSHNFQLNKLKELLNEVAQAQIGEIEQIKEVLWELINNTLLIKRKSPSESYDFLVGLLAKLDVRSAAHTEEVKFDVKGGYYKNGKIHSFKGIREDNSFNKIKIVGGIEDRQPGGTGKKASGGDYNQDCKRCDYDFDEDCSEGCCKIKAEKKIDEKQPEPNCDNCWKKGNYDLFMCPTKEKCIPARDYSPKGPEERVRDATRIVKREDLQRWKKEFEKSGNPEWEYIEEEYTIE